MSSPRGRGRGRGIHRGKQNGRGSQFSHNRDTPIAERAIAKVDRPAATNDQELNWDLPERFRKGKANKHHRNDDGWTSTQQSDLEVTLNIDIRKYVQDQNSIQSTGDKDRWLDALEIPKASEIHLTTDAMVDLAPNKIHDRFKTLRSYLKTHYALLREDATGPLRDVIDKFRKDPEMLDDADLSVYEKVHVSGFTFTNMGIAARLKFSTRRAGRKILWSASKRLVSGSLVALTPADDNFSKKCIIAIVAARPLELLERSPPEVDIYFGSTADIQIDPQIAYIMVESKQGYFEAYRHTLRAIQKLSRESFAFSTNVTGWNLDIDPPRYLEDLPRLSLVAALDPAKESTRDLSLVDTIRDWPSTPEGTTLDDSQWDALRQILTKKLAIIQGPPGTGKTHVSKVALQIMVQNRAEKDPPIIVAAQTNHALDQLLKHVSRFDPEFIRLGGRSTNSDIKKRALYEVRQREIIPNVPGSLFAPAKKKLAREHAKYGELLSIFDENSELVSCDKLFELGIINASQLKSLTEAVANWVSTEGEQQNPMQHWLHEVLIPFEVDYDDDSYGFDEQEEDLEMEQLNEIEAEHGLVDEEDIEMLRGPWKAVTDCWTVATPSEADLEQAKRMLDIRKDLWDIPEYLRGPAYLVMKQKAKEATLAKFKDCAVEYARVVEELKIGKWEKDAVFLKRANIIGLTTTGLSKYRPLIASLRPKIVLIEEAAEVLEGPVTAACMDSVEHLILVGDHKQLQGHCSLQEMEGDPFHLNVSMFERLVNIGMPYRTLSRQRRMTPEIRQLISSLYPNLEDHESVLTRPQLPLWGTGLVRSFFFHHDWSELKDESLSTYNEEEARMVVKFYRHLMRNGVPPAAVTILTFYNGQRKRILRELKNDAETNASYNNVKTVDSYQGEENDIVILSLVRSNPQGQIGFLEIDNRVCVALSRARHGFYLFGNGYLLSEKSELWSNVGRLMSDGRPLRFGTKLPLTCVKHRRTLTVQWPDEFDSLDGGCDLLCGGTLSCGHKCEKYCHAIPDEQLSCNKICGKLLVCGHLCSNKCSQVCHCECDLYRTIPYSEDRSGNNEDGVGYDVHGQIVDSLGITDHQSPGGRSRLISNLRGIRTSNQSGRALARGGAAFQPLSPVRIGPHESLTEGIDIAGHYSKPSGNERRHDWTSFAAGGAVEDDHKRERAHNQTEDRGVADLIDLASPDDASIVVEATAEERLRSNRTKYTQAYRPSKPRGAGALSTGTHAERVSQQATPDYVPNLMD